MRQNAIEVVKMRYSKHEKKMVIMEITKYGIKVYPSKRISLEM